MKGSHLFSAKVYLALLIALFGPFLPLLDASVKRAESDRVLEIAMLKKRCAPEKACSYGIERISGSGLPDPVAMSTEALDSSVPLTEAKSDEIKRFLMRIDELSKNYALSPELASFKEKLARRVGYVSPNCAVPVVAAGGVLTILTIGVIVIVAVVVVNGVIQISSGGGGLSNPIDPARQAIEQAIRDCYRQLEILYDLLQHAASSEEFQAIMDMILAKWEEIDNLLRQLWDLLHPGSGRLLYALDMWEELD